jgi:predicted ABC-type ATPase
MPTLYVLGGANGVGKTTWYQTGVQNNSITPELPFINVDYIVTREFGGYTPENIALAEQMARDRMKELIGGGRDFMIESNLAKTSDYEWIELMRKNGYETNLYFLGTGDVEINKARVQERVKEGGHDIAIPIIEQRYQMGLSHLKKEILSFTNVTLIDVASDIPKKIAELKEGKVIFKEINCPKWVMDTLTLAERLAEKQNFKSLLNKKSQTEDKISLLKKNKNSGNKHERGI